METTQETEYEKAEKKFKSAVASARLAFEKAVKDAEKEFNSECERMTSRPST